MNGLTGLNMMGIIIAILISIAQADPISFVNDIEASEESSSRRDLQLTTTGSPSIAPSQSPTSQLPEFCPDEIINPTCSDGTQFATDYEYPCLDVNATCNTTLVNYEEVSCTNWICSLRVNCGCFAGLDTSCASNFSTCTKTGCNEVLSMFQELSCNFSDYLGVRNDSGLFDEYLNQCLEGCNAGSYLSISAFALALSLVAAMIIIV